MCEFIFLTCSENKNSFVLKLCAAVYNLYTRGPFP